MSALALVGLAVAGGLWAVVAEIILGVLWIPMWAKVGVKRHLTKGLLGVGLAVALGVLWPPANVIAAAVGAIALHDAVKAWLTRPRAAPGRNTVSGSYSAAFATQDGAEKRHALDVLGRVRRQR